VTDVDLTDPIFHDENKAREHLETTRWPDGPFCPHCGSVNVHRMAGETQAGMWLCNDCRDKFTCRTGTVMERSHIPLHKWLYAMYLLVTARKGISSMQLAKEIGITQKSAWFMLHRIRLAMQESGFRCVSTKMRHTA
jgi:transposase-like protein